MTLPNGCTPANSSWQPKNAIYLLLDRLPTAPSQREVLAQFWQGSPLPVPYPLFSFAWSGAQTPDRTEMAAVFWKHMQPNTFDVIPKRKHITIFKLGKLWIFKQFFEDKAQCLALLGNYNKDQYRFEFTSIGARNNALKLLERSGFDYDLVEDLKGYVVQLPKSAKYAQILKNSVAFKETVNERIFLMKDLAAVEEAVSLGAKIREGETSF